MNKIKLFLSSDGQTPAGSDYLRIIRLKYVADLSMIGLTDHQVIP